jgi:hypothetical protein
LNRYRVRPWESTRIFPRLLFATPTVAACPLDVFGGDDGSVAPPPPQAAAASAPGNTSAIEVRKVMRLLAVMLVPVVGDERDRGSDERLSNRETDHENA